MAHTRRITISSVDSATPYLQTMCEPHPPVASNSLQPSLAFCVDNSSPQYMSTYHQALQTTSTSTATTLVVSQSVCGNANTTGASYIIINSPPPLIPTRFPYDPLPVPPHLSSVNQQTQLLPSVDTPFKLCLYLVMYHDVMDVRAKYTGTKTKAFTHHQVA